MESLKNKKLKNTPSKGKADKTNKIIAAGAASALTGGALSTAIDAQYSIPNHDKPFDKSLFAHFLVKDKPLNEIPLIVAHNAETNIGSGTLFGVGNQSMSITDMLDKTPVRGFKFPVHRHNGQIIINHGGIVDPTVSSPTLLKDALTEIRQWLDKHPDEACMVILDNYVPNKYITEVTKIAQDTLNSNDGTSIYSPTYVAVDHQWDSINEMTARGEQVVLIGDKMDSSNLMRQIDVMNDGVYHTRPIIDNALISQGESRTAFTEVIGEKIHHEALHSITAERVDELVRGGGAIIQMDQVGIHDPRFLLPEDRNKYGSYMHDKSILSDLLYVSDPTFSQTLHSSAMALGGAVSSIALFSGLYGAYLIEKRIKNFQRILTTEIDRTNLSDILHYMKIKNINNLPDNIDEKILLEYCYKRLQKEMLLKTFTTGVGGSTSLASGLAIIMLLLPGSGLIIGYIALAIAVTGVAVAIIASIINYIRMRRAYNHHHATIQQRSMNKAQQLSMLILQKKTNTRQHTATQKTVNDLASNKIKPYSNDSNTNNDLIFTKNKNDKALHILWKTSAKLALLGLFVRVSSFAKYAAPTVRSVSAGFGIFMALFSATITIPMSHLKRSKLFKNFNQVASAKLYNDIFSRRRILLKKSMFDEYLSKNKRQIISQLKIKHIKEAKKVIINNEALLHYYTSVIMQENLLQKIIKYRKEVNGTNIRHYLAHSVRKGVFRQILLEGTIVNISITAAIGSMIFFLPEIALAFIIAATINFIVSTIITAIFAHKESKLMSRKFKSEYQCKGAVDEIEKSDLTKTINRCVAFCNQKLSPDDFNVQEGLSQQITNEGAAIKPTTDSNKKAEIITEQTNQKESEQQDKASKKNKSPLSHKIKQKVKINRVIHTHSGIADKKR